jgi:hypothetical protein
MTEQICNEGVADDRSGYCSADSAAIDARCALFPMTDLGNAERFVERYRDRLAWCRCHGWQQWNGSRWTRDRIGEELVLAQDATVRAIQREAEYLTDTCGNRRSDLQAWGLKSESSYRRSVITKIAACLMVAKSCGA